MGTGDHLVPVTRRLTGLGAVGLTVVAVVVVVVVAAFAIVITRSDGSDGRSAVDKLAEDPLLVDTPLPAEGDQPATVDPARDEAFGVEEDFHTAVASWSVERSIDETASAWAEWLVDGGVWHEVTAVCRSYADGGIEIGLGARRSAGDRAVSASIEIVPTGPNTSHVLVTLVAPVADDGEAPTDGPPDLDCLAE
jgi:hypothetical protein